MKNKSNRINMIHDIIQNQCIASQEELLQALKERGHEVTQATLSRDLKQMQIAKVATSEGIYMYVLPEVAALAHDKVLPHVVLPKMSGGIVNIECSNVLVVVRTRPGFASSFAYDLDMCHPDAIMGTVAGDDTILVIPRAGYTPMQAAQAVCSLLPKSNNEQ